MNPRWTIATCCASIAVIMGLTAGAIVVVPDIGRDLGGRQSDLQWATDSFPWWWRRSCCRRGPCWIATDAAGGCWRGSCCSRSRSPGRAWPRRSRRSS